MEGEERLRTSSISAHSEQHSRQRLSSHLANLNLTEYYVDGGNQDSEETRPKSMMREGNVFYVSESGCSSQLDVNQLREHYVPSHRLMCPMSSSSSYYQPKTLFVPAMRVENDKLSDHKKKCCFNLCSCSKICPSNSSIWSLSEPDLTQNFRVINNEDNQDRTRLQIDDQYEHLTRVITPPNAFLNQTYNEPHDFGRPSTAQGVSYSNKVTQTDTRYILKKQKERASLQRHFSLIESPLEGRSSQQTEGPNRHSVDTEHIYHTIGEREHWRKQQEFQKQLKQLDKPTRPSNDQTQSRMRPNLSEYEYHYNIESEPHKIATSTKNGLPCQCNQCREARGNYKFNSHS